MDCDLFPFRFRLMPMQQPWAKWVYRPVTTPQNDDKAWMIYMSLGTFSKFLDPLRTCVNFSKSCCPRTLTDHRHIMVIEPWPRWFTKMTHPVAIAVIGHMFWQSSITWFDLELSYMIPENATISTSWRFTNTVLTFSYKTIDKHIALRLGITLNFAANFKIGYCVNDSKDRFPSAVFPKELCREIHNIKFARYNS